MKHITVLLKEAVDALSIAEGDVVLDCTFGAGGHSNEILERLNGTGTLISIDADETAFQDKESATNQRFVVGNFRDIGEILRKQNLTAADAILADLGWRTDQFTDGAKGFSFQNDEPLLMTFGTPDTATFTAYDIVNSWDEENIADIIYGYGEERAARKIAAAIVRARAEAPIKTSFELANIVAAEVGKFYQKSRIHPATKTFQALRIAVNDELGALKDLLEAGFAALTPGGRMAIITFHSLEDRIVKHTFKRFALEKRGTLPHRKPRLPGQTELSHNPRSRSAKLRTIEKT